ncbi:hypothetical protein ABEV00_15780 [Paenibacillus thiaminolyticus]|uniref:hypothetical protein n=1 Tax=Paenibacillus TaxID=44249 RepID=UPI001059F1DE|nr:hypothetical protein [Paenibacillus dendritiformis]TDL51761.1 hypothetical protein E2R60_19295 [Paenibacillus dendritiformis]
MKASISLDGFEGQEVEVKTNGLGKPRLFINRQPVPVGKKGRMTLRRNDGTEAIATWKNSVIGDLPKLVVDGNVIELAKPAPWYVKLWCVLPLALIFVGGAIGGALGGIGAIANFAVFRTQLPAMAKYMTTLLMTIACAAGWWMLAMMAAGRL